LLLEVIYKAQSIVLIAYLTVDGAFIQEVKEAIMNELNEGA